MTNKEFDAQKFYKGITVVYEPPKCLNDDTPSTGTVTKVFFNDDDDCGGGGVCIKDKYGTKFIHYSRILELK